MRYLITGACGFIGSNFADYILMHDKESTILNMDKHTTISNNYLDIKYFDNLKYKSLQLDLANSKWHDHIENDNFDIVIHFAAESHVDRSCEDVQPFIDSNITATMNVVNFCIKKDIPLVYVSTDEVYGELGPNEPPFTENTPIKPRNPYSATKAAGEFILIGLANASNYKKYAITRCSNNFGPLQDKTKFIPVCIGKLLRHEKIPLYGDGRQIRDWIHVLDHCEAIRLIAKRLENSMEIVPNIFNVGANNERSNMEIAEMICDIMGVSHENGISFIPDPRGNAHDFRYSIDSSRLSSEFHWNPERSIPFEKALENTIAWYESHREIV